MKALVFSTVGQPSEVLRLEEIEEVRPATGELLLQMLFSPVNPSDLHMVRGSTATNLNCLPVRVRKELG